MISQIDYTACNLNGTTCTSNGYSDTNITTNYSYSISYSNYSIDRCLVVNLLRLEHLRMARSGWNNPKVIGIEKKPIIHNSKMVIRNQLPRKIRIDL